MKTEDNGLMWLSFSMHSFYAEKAEKYNERGDACGRQAPHQRGTTDNQTDLGLLSAQLLLAHDLLVASGADIGSFAT